MFKFLILYFLFLSFSPLYASENCYSLVDKQNVKSSQVVPMRDGIRQNDEDQLNEGNILNNNQLVYAGVKNSIGYSLGVTLLDKNRVISNAQYRCNLCVTMFCGHALDCCLLCCYTPIYATPVVMCDWFCESPNCILNLFCTPFLCFNDVSSLDPTSPLYDNLRRMDSAVKFRPEQSGGEIYTTTTVRATLMNR